MRLTIIALSLALSGLVIWYAAGGEWRERALQNEIDTTKDIRDAQNACPDDMPWFDRLQCINNQ